MSTTQRETDLAAVFVALAGIIDSDAGVVDTLHELAVAAAALPPVNDTGILLSDSQGALHVMASTTERADHIDLLRLGAVDGPCAECFASGLQVNVDDLTAVTGRWSQYCERSLKQNVRAVHALPLRLRETTIGALSLFSDAAGAFTDQDVALAQALADVATIAIMQTRTLDRHRQVEDQLRRALESRVLIEQAKGIIAGRRRIPVDDAFELLRNYARAHSAKLHHVAQLVVDHSISI